MDITLEAITKAYNGKTVLDGLSAVFPEGEVTCIMAPSGWGKTTLLRLLMGLERPDSGAIRGMEGRRMSAVFQEDRLCAYLTPADNIRLANPALEREEVLAALAAVGLAGCAGQPALELSGGQRRRVAILRALLATYDVLFLDEPFRGLDVATKEQVMADASQRCAGRTTILVTHDAAEMEAMAAAHRLRFGD